MGTLTFAKSVPLAGWFISLFHASMFVFLFPNLFVGSVVILLVILSLRQKSVFNCVVPVAAPTLRSDEHCGACQPWL